MRHRFGDPRMIATTVSLIAVLAGSPTIAQEDPVESAIADTVLSLVEEYNAAWEEWRAEPILRFHSDDFEYYWFDRRIGEEFGHVLREEWLPEAVEYSIEMIDPRVNLLGRDGAIVSFRFTDRWTDSTGSTRESAGALGYVFERREGGWKIVRIHQAGPVPEEYTGLDERMERERALADTVLTLAREVNAAWSDRRPADLIRHFSDDSQYYWRGLRMSRNVLEQVLREEIERQEPVAEMIDPRVEVLGTNAAVVSYQFGPAADLADVHGAVTFVFERRDGRWKIVHVHESPRSPAGGPVE